MKEPSEGPRAAIAVERSENSKLGDCSATYVAQQSCPTDCPFRRNGCYAEQGTLGFSVTARLNRANKASAAELARQEATCIDSLSGERYLRLHVVGDARTNGAARVLAAAARRYTARWTENYRIGVGAGKSVWTYTHAWRRVRRASWGASISVLASCQTLAEVQEAHAAGYAAALVVPRFRQSSAYPLDDAGLTLLPCPAQTKTGVTCVSCGLCRDDARLLDARIIIGFVPHGSGAKKVLASLPVV